MLIDSEVGKGSVFTVYLPARTTDNVHKLYRA
jgi:two-component system phosphate regulon sensor histidine kinase PhoR